MKNLFEKSVYQEMIDRINSLSPVATASWGKMNVGQMLTHINRAFKVPLSEKPLKRTLLGYLVGWYFKKDMMGEKPWRRNLPTASYLTVTDDRDFQKEKTLLLELLGQFFSKGPDGVGIYPHPIFGRLSSQEWGVSMYKHLDHHLQQFGV